MKDDRIFFSYSRNETEFAMNLAKQLQEAGASVWIDQMNIKAGDLWDKAVEEALTNASTLLLIISKHSVKSQNVVDEVAWAIAEGKKLIPVLMEDCEMPMRWRRFQYVDFSQSYDQGIEHLITHLGLEKKVATKLAAEATEKSAMSVRELESALEYKDEFERTVEKEVAARLKARLEEMEQATSVEKVEEVEEKEPENSGLTFISYSRDDIDFVTQLVEKLTSDGVKVWTDKILSGNVGMEWDEIVAENIKTCKEFIVVLSNNSVKSKEVKSEYFRALRLGKSPFPVIIDDCEIPLRLEIYQHTDFRSNYDLALESLKRSLN
ncbi:MAG: toll/interleukin-1 receptor domain-containing protein [Flavobacteriaceae bacterium]|nr:toll/interleukin-1 receptor domain-containing protein [Flavobacteriaceae bacterium]